MKIMKIISKLLVVSILLTVFSIVYTTTPLVFAESVSVNCSGTSGAPTAVTEADLAGDDVTFADTGGDGYCVIDEAISANSVTVSTGVTITHTAADVDGVTITTVGDFTIQELASINADSKGCQNNPTLNAVANGYGPNGSNVCTISTAGYSIGSDGSGELGSGGAGHGGSGGNGKTTAGGTYYDTNTAPVLFGSSAGNAYATSSTVGVGGDGGGLVKLAVGGNFVFNGNISVDGGNGAVQAWGGGAGGGSGGSIYVSVAGAVSGTTGTFSSDGGTGANGAGIGDGGGGAGGRIAVTYLTSTFSFDSSDFTVSGGTAAGVNATAGGNGTVYVEDTDDNIVNIYHGFDYSTDYSETTWTVDSSATNQYCNVSTDTSPSITATNLTLGGTLTCANATLVSFNFSASTSFSVNNSTSISITTTGSTVDFNIPAGNNQTWSALTFTGAPQGMFTINDATGITLTGNSTITSNTQWTNLTALQIDSGSSINANSMGCQNNPTLNAVANGYGPNGSNVCTISTAGYSIGSDGSGSLGAGGAGHGGSGGNGTTTAGGASYDSNTAPVLFGSSAGNAYATSSTVGVGGDGGGLVRLAVSGNFIFNGSITVDGGNGAVNLWGGGAGGGSGGSIYVSVGGAVSGTTGTFSSDGGTGANGSGSGDGGGGAGGRVSLSYGADSTTYIAGLVASSVTAGGTGFAVGNTGSLYTVQVVYISSIDLAGGASYTNDSTPEIAITQSGATPTHVAFSCDNSNWSSWLAYPDDEVVNDGDGPAFDMTTDATGCSATNELKTIYAKIKDGSSESSVVSDTTTYDTQAPTVQYVTASNANGTYGASVVLGIEVVFTEDVIESGGTSAIELDFNGTDRSAVYSSGSLTPTLTFNYTTVNGDNKTDLDYVATGSLTSDGSTITDRAGNSATLTLPTVGGVDSLAGRKDITVSTNQAPTAATVSGVELADGTGGVTVRFTLDDADLDDTLQAKVEYNIGGGWTKATILETSGTGSSFGQFNVENDNAYQVGNSNGYVTSSEGANEIEVVWDSATDEPTANLSTAQIRITPYDGIEAGSAATSSNFTIDNVDPASLASFASSADTSTTVTLTWTAATDTNFDHYEIWYGTSQPAVEGRTASEWDNSDDATLATATTATTTITGLTAAQTYYMKIWAIDDYGNSSTLATITVNNNGLPTASTLTGAQTTTGNGVVNISFVADDSNDDDTLQYKLEYYVGGSWTKATILETSGTGASYGQFNIENDNTYQIGNSNGYITSSEGANTITIIWDAQTDLGTTDTASAQVRVTPYDGTEIGVILTSDAFTLDQADPAGGLTSLSSAGVVYTSFTLGWSAITTESNFDKYQIYYKLSSASTYTLYSEESTMTTGSKAITGLTEGTTYTFYVKALDTFGNSLTSTTLSVTMEDTSNPYFGAITGGGSAGASSWWLNPVEITIEIPPTTDTSEGSSSGQSEEEQEEEIIEEVTENFEEVWEEEVVEQLSGHWAEPYLKDFYETTLINEIFQNETSDAQIISYLFDPEQKMTRGDFLKSVMDLLGLDYAKEVQYIPFSDMTADTENIEYIISAYYLGIISGYADGTFNPDGDINRAESLKIIFNIIGENITPLTGRPLLEYYDLPSNPFPDVDIDAWYAPYVIYAYMNGIVSGYGDGYFRPDRTISLGEMAKILTLVVRMAD